MRLPSSTITSAAPMTEQKLQTNQLYALDRASLLKSLAASAEGLSSTEAEQRLTDNGPNEATAAPRLGSLKQYLLLLADPLVIILLIASLVSAVLGQQLNSGIIVVIVLLSVTLNFLQTNRSNQAVLRLRAQIAITSTVLRDGAGSVSRPVWKRLRAGAGTGLY